MKSPALNAEAWQGIDTVLLDLDGTLLDLRFDNRFWSHVVPQAWGAANGSLSPEAAQALLLPRFRSREGTLDWYCIDYWTRELGVDVAALKRAAAHGIAWLPGAREFLLRVRKLGKRLVLLTNAHPTTLEIKDDRTGVRGYFDASFSSHVFGVPKEHPHFWSRLAQVERFDTGRSLFVDDSLPVLRAAHRAGVASLYAVRRPDTSRAERHHDEFASVAAVADLL